MAEETALPMSSNAELQASREQSNTNAEDAPNVNSATDSVKEGASEADGMNKALGTNGTGRHTNQDHSENSNNPTEESKVAEDTEMKKTEDTGATAGMSASPAARVTNGTPAHSKRASVGGSSKKKSSAIPEHKTKKLNKKKSKTMTILNAQPGEYYIARMKGHPPWPSIICDEDMLPRSLLTTRPITAQLPDGTFKKPEYADGGKRAHERTYPIMFLHTNEFAWIPNTELTLLDVESDAVKNPVEKGKSKTLLEAYKEASKNQDLDHFKSVLAGHQEALEQDQQDREELEKERAAKKAKKASRKSNATIEDADEMEIDDDVVAEKPKSRKRKKADETEDAEDKPAKTPKTATKLKLSTPKTPVAEPSTKKRAPKTKSAKAAKSGSEDDAATPKTEEKPLTPQAAKEIKEKKVLYYRHKLQRGFLARDTTPKEDEMKTMSDFLHELEAYPDLEGSIIRVTKIHKVLKAMIKLPSIPLDEEYKFKTRSIDLLGKWNEILSNDTTGGPSGDRDEEGKGDDGAQAPAPTTNGAAKGTEEQAVKAAVGESAAPEDETEAKLGNKIGTSIEGDEEAEKPEEDTPDIEKSAEEQKTDAPAIDSAPAEAYKPEATA